MTLLYPAASCLVASALIAVGDYRTIIGNAVENEMTMRMLLVKVPGDHILRVLGVNANFLHPFLGKLRHKAVAFFAVRKTMCIFRGERY